MSRPGVVRFYQLNQGILEGVQHWLAVANSHRQRKLETLQCA
jgi:hypothetical protein